MKRKPLVAPLGKMVRLGKRKGENYGLGERGPLSFVVCTSGLPGLCGEGNGASTTPCGIPCRLNTANVHARQAVARRF